MTVLRILFVSMCVILSGCVTAPASVKPADNQVLGPVPASKARIVFLRPSYVGSVISASVHDVSSAETKFIGISTRWAKLAYDVDPGERTFMVVSETADFMQGNLTAGKTYYALVTPRMGAWVARFSLWPVRADGTS